MYLAARNYPLTTQYPISEMFRRIRAAGYDGLEFCLTNKFQQLRPDTIEPFYRKHVKEQADENGLKISMVSCHPDMVYDDTVFQLEKKAIPIIREFGTDLFLIGTNYNYFAGLGSDILRRDDPTYMDGYYRRMKELLHIAEDNDVRLAVEPELQMALLNVDDYFRLYEVMDSRNLVYNFDVGHAFLTEPDLLAAVRRLQGHIAHTHFENMRRGEHWHRLPEDGDIDLQAVLQELKQTGYDGAICVEVHAYDQLAPECVNPLRRMLDAVQNGKNFSENP